MPKVVRSRQAGTRCVLSVEDEGPGVAPGFAAHAFDAFRRGTTDGVVVALRRVELAAGPRIVQHAVVVRALAPLDACHPTIVARLPGRDVRFVKRMTAGAVHLLFHVQIEARDVAFMPGRALRFPDADVVGVGGAAVGVDVGLVLVRRGVVGPTVG